MVPKINQRGHSFKGVTAYLMHDKGAQTSERVAWSETGNMYTSDIEKAALVMAYTDKNADILKRDFVGNISGRKSQAGNVYHYSLSWAQGEQPDTAHQRQQAFATLQRLGLDAHQYYMVSHDDTKHSHVHIVANLTHPETGKICAPSFDKRELQAYALEYEREHGLHCKARVENAAKRERGEHLKHQDTKQDYSRKVTRAYFASDSGKAFIHALKAEGLQLARARRGNSFVIVDDKGEIQKLSRQLDIEEKGKHKSAAIAAKLSDINREALKDANALAQDIKAEIEQKAKPYDRDAEEIKKQNALLDAAEKAAPEKAKAQNTEAAALKEKQARAREDERKQDMADKQERYAAYQKRIDEKTAASRKTWQIDELTKKRDIAAADLEKRNSVWSRLFQRDKFTQAHDHHQDMEKRLAERITRHRADIEAFNKNRPEWVLKRELEKHGFREKAEKKQTEEMEATQKKRVQEHVEDKKAVTHTEATAELQSEQEEHKNAEKERIDRLAALSINDNFSEGAGTAHNLETFWKGQKIAGQEKPIENEQDQATEHLEEMNEIFSERQEEIKENMDYSEEEREQALHDLEHEYQEQQQITEREQDHGLER